MPLLTPECLWCGKKWVVFHATRANGNTTSYHQPATSTRWPSIHLHFECSSEFLSALHKETGEIPGMTILDSELADRRGLDTNFPLRDHYYEPQFWRRFHEEPATGD